MHVPDGFFDAPVSLAAGAVAAGAVAVSLRGAKRELDDRLAPLAGLVAAFVFAVQMINFPVGAGTSGHLMGGALAAILVGPYTAVLCLSVVLLIQALLFADGGLTALGVNITLLGVVAVLVAYPLFRLLTKTLPRGRSSVGIAAFVAALVSVPAAAVAFTGLFAIGGTADVPLGRVLAAMVGVHAAIGLGEAAITAMTVGAVLAVRPDLVHGARDLRRPLVLRTTRTDAGVAAASAGVAAAGAEAAPADAVEAAGAAGAGRRSARPVWLAGLAASLLCAGVLSFYASQELDGLERVSTDHGIMEREREHDLADSPLADYELRDVDNGLLSGGTAGVLGVGATLAVGTGVLLLVRRRDRDRVPSATTTGAGPNGAGRESRGSDRGDSRSAPDAG
ncbi:energy-coupling factor ABC transporter permease [Streptomyces durbertensis]|uniref:Energy-coupling factor ABC transporter permease n=1 Tax=Streptomyces durbertensis TaxID=2448886 RepID=A0ABR6EAP8_9ACTN|nr:energy-coupling factor ABC transporter permease [Streptomyces durbertensis]MBB1242412.1 energy-coupling factor ABC transporter permease [Streptomyces durbertensis]